MKKKCECFRSTFPEIKKLFLVMRTTLFILLISFCTVSAKSFSQTQKITLELKNASLSEVFDEIERQTNFSVFYKKDQIKDDRIISISRKNTDLKSILEEVLRDQNVDFKVLQNEIVITPKSSFINENGTQAQQQKTITGKVTDKSGSPMPGVTVVEVSTNNGTITDAEGNYTLSGVKTGNKISFRFVGMKTQEVVIQNQSTVNVLLEEETIGLEEVVAVGYGVQKKSDVTGAMVSVGADEITSRPVANAIQAMQGKAAGVDITSSERPGQLGQINIRGVRSLTASNSPLYVVDGIPLVTNVINEDQNVVLGGIDNLNTNDIESIDILKDASATAIYGSRGANGVILITTKKGKSGKLSLNYTGSVTAETLQDDSELFSAGEYIEWRRWSKYYANPAVFPRGDQPTKANDYLIFLGSGDPSAWANIEKGWASGTWDPSKVTTTNWTGIVTRTGITQEHTISASGGTNKMNGYVSFGYLDNKGTVRGQGYTRYTGKASFDVIPKEWFSIGGNINGSYSVNEYGQSTVGRNGLVNQGGLYATARMIFPYTVPYDSNGNRVEYPGGDIAVKTVVDEWKYSQDQRVTYRMMGSFYIGADLGKISSVFNGLKFRMNFGPDFSTYRDGVYLDANSVIRTGSSFASLLKSQTFTYTLDNLLYYDRTFGKHTMGITLLQSQTKFNYETSFMSASGIPFSSQKWNALSSSNVSLDDWSSDLTEKQLMSYMARMNYSFADKYLLTVSGRYDGASQLAEGHKWSFFPSAALGWRMDQEGFLDNVDWIDQLKLRMGVGVTGNSAIGPYYTKGGLTSLFYAIGSTTTPGSKTSTVLANQGLGWEKTTQYNLGFDYSIFNGRISGLIDLYTSKTTDLLMEMTIPPVTGYSTTYANIGETANKGIDLTLNTVNIRTDKLQWSTSFNASWSKDRIVSLANGKEDDINNGWFINQPQGVIYGYESAGIWKEEDATEMAKFNANGHSFSAGMSRPVDQNGDYIIDANHDRVIIGNTRPNYILGMTNTVNYANFELSVFLFGRLGYWYDTGGEYQGGRFNQRKISYYNENNKNSDYQKPIYTEGSGDPYSGILGYKKASFIKVRNISLGYKVPNRAAASLGISNMKVFVQATNPGTLFRKIDWIDMDLVSSNWNRGFTAGVNIEF